MRERVVRFGLVGVFNTLSNLVWFNALIFLFGWSIGLANIVSTAFSILISFWLNARFVFRGADSRKMHHVFMLFMAATIFSQFIVQQAALLFFLHVFTWPAHVTIDLARQLPAVSRLSDTFYRANVAKCLAVGISMTVNFVLYDRAVFAQSKKAAPHAQDKDPAKA